MKRHEDISPVGEELTDEEVRTVSGGRPMLDPWDTSEGGGKDKERTGVITTPILEAWGKKPTPRPKPKPQPKPDDGKKEDKFTGPTSGPGCAPILNFF